MKHINITNSLSGNPFIEIINVMKEKLKSRYDLSTTYMYARMFFAVKYSLAHGSCLRETCKTLEKIELIDTRESIRKIHYCLWKAWEGYNPEHELQEMNSYLYSAEVIIAVENAIKEKI